MRMNDWEPWMPWPRGIKHTYTHTHILHNPRTSLITAQRCAIETFNRTSRATQYIQEHTYIYSINMRKTHTTRTRARFAYRAILPREPTKAKAQRKGSFILQHACFCMSMFRVWAQLLKNDRTRLKCRIYSDGAYAKLYGTPLKTLEW